MSRHHARIDDQAGRWVLTDLGSSAGTWHEGELITSIALSGRQDLVLGDPTTGDTITVEAPMSGAPGSGLISNRGFAAPRLPRPPRSAARR